MKKFMMLAAALGVSVALGAVTYVEAGGEVELSAQDAGTGNNSANNRIWFRGDGTVKLTGTLSENALFTVSPTIFATNGNITVDATALGTCRGLRWHNHARVDGTLTVKGTDYIEFGSYSASAKYDDINVVSFWFNPEFVQAGGATYAEPAGVVFTNAVTMVTKPTCAWRIAKGCWFWPYAKNSLGTAGETLEVTDYNLGIVNVNSIAAPTVKLGSGCLLSCRPCIIDCANQKDDPGNFWKWGGTSDTWPCNVVLDGGTLYTASSPVFTFGGNITGAGNVELRGKATVVLGGRTDFTGSLKMYNAGVMVTGNQPLANVITCKSATQGSVDFNGEGCGSSATTGELGGIEGGTAGGKLPDRARLADAGGGNRFGRAFGYRWRE